MTTPQANSSNDPVKRKGSFHFKSPKSEKSEQSPGPGTVKPRPESEIGLPQTEAKSPEQTSEPATSVRPESNKKMDGGKKKKHPLSEAGHTDSDKVSASRSAAMSITAATATTTTSTTSTTSTASTTVTTTTLSPAAANTKSNSSPSDREIADSPSLPREHWLHYCKGSKRVFNDFAAVGGRGRTRFQQLELMRTSLQVAPDQLFRKNASKPTLWIQEFRMVAEPVWADLLHALEAESQRAEIKAAIDSPDQHMAVLEQSFSTVIKTWASKGQGRFVESVPPAMRAMAGELLEAIRQAQKGKAIKQPQEQFVDLMRDLLVFSLVDLHQAPQPYSRLFGNYMAGFLGRDPTCPELFRVTSDVLIGSINKWRFDLALEFVNFDPALALLALSRPVQEFELLPTSDNFARSIEKPMKRFKSFNTLFGMMPIVKDPRFAPPLRRDLSNTLSSSTPSAKTAKWFERKNGNLVELTGNLDAMDKALNKYGPQSVIAQALCTQIMWAISNAILFGEAEAQSPFKDASKRPVIPNFSALDSQWIIERLEDETLQVSCNLRVYAEQVKVLEVDDTQVGKPPLPSETAGAGEKHTERLVLPGWLESEITIRVSTDCDIDVTRVKASAFNLHLTEGGYPAVQQDEPPSEDVVKSESRSALKSLRRLSQRFTAPLHFEKEDETPTSPRKGNSSRVEPKAKAKEKQ